MPTFANFEADKLLSSEDGVDLWIGRDRRFDEAVAIKEIRPIEGLTSAVALKYRDALVDAARQWAALEHDNIVQVLDYGVRSRERVYVVMELIDGPSLDAVVLTNGSVDEADATRIAIYIARALELAHSNGVLHGGINPSNLLWAMNGAVKLSDFGIADLIWRMRAEAGRTGRGAAFRAPEQLANRTAEPTIAADIFAIGATMMTLLAGEAPFERLTQAESVRAVLNDQPRPLCAAKPALDPAWDGILSRTLMKAPERRYEDASKLLRAFIQLSAADQSTMHAEAPFDDPVELELVVVGGPDRGRRVPLKDAVEIGRGEGQLTLTDDTVSTRHCRVEARGEAVLVRDQGSRNGTWLDRKKIDELVLHDGQTFRVGLHTLIRIDLRQSVSDQFTDAVDGLTELDAATIDSMAAASGQPRFIVTVEKGPREGWEFTITGTAMIGREQGDIPLQDPRVSRRHAEIDVSDPTRIVVRDLKSSNGTLVDDQRITEVVLEPGKSIQVGSSVLTIQPAAEGQPVR